MQESIEIQRNSLYGRIGGKSVIDNIVNNFLDKMLADYRVKRFFNDHNEVEQREALQTYLAAALGTANNTEDQLIELLDNCFIACFARDKRKSFVSEADFGFFGMIISQDKPSTKVLCPAHSHLLRYMPDDSHYDIVMEHLADCLQELNIDKNLAPEILALAESARNQILGV